MKAKGEKHPLFNKTGKVNPPTTVPNLPIIKNVATAIALHKKNRIES